MLSYLAGNNAHGDRDPALLYIPVNPHKHLHSSDQILVRYKKYLNYSTNCSKFHIICCSADFRQLTYSPEFHLPLGFD